MNLKNKPDAYEVEKQLEKLLTDVTPIDKIDARWMDAVIYFYPQKWLRFLSSREQKLRNK